MSNSKASHPDNERPKLHHLLGTAALIFAAAILFLALVDRSARLDFMPSTWFSHRMMWYFLGITSFLAGVLALKNPPPSLEAQRALLDSPDVRFQKVTLYTRKNCPLCDEAKDTLHDFRHYLPPVEETDIDEHPELVEKYCDCVPVVMIDEKIRFRGRVNETLLKRLIDGAAPRDRKQAS